MAPRIQWCEQIIKDVNIVPRLEDHLIDELFYQEDEIGEMRHTAFMIECGLEEDPPDGPDVPPIPWGDMLLKQQQQQQQDKERKNKVAEKKGTVAHSDDRTDIDDSVSRDKQRPKPIRSRSNDDIDTLAIELTTAPKMSPKRRTPKRTASSPLDMFVVDGASSPASLYKPTAIALVSPNRRPPKRIPTKSTSELKPERTLRSPEDRKKRNTPKRGRLSHTRSGTCHELASAAARAKEKMDDQRSEMSKSPSNRKLTKTRSGTSHLAAAAMKAKMKLNEEREKEKDKNNSEPYVPRKSPSVLQRKQAIEIAKQKSASRPAPLIRSLVATNSGTLHGMRKTLMKDDVSKADNSEEETKIVFKNGKRTIIRKGASMEYRSKPNGSNSKKKSTENVIYRNGKKEIIKRHSSDSSDNSDNDFLGDIVKDSDDESVARSEISISTSDSDVPHRRISPRKENKRVISKSVDQTLKSPTRRSSLTKHDDGDENGPGWISPNSSRSNEKELKKKKKKKKKNGDSNEIPSDSISSKKTKKKKKGKKEKESLDLHDSFSSPVSLYSPISSERKKKQNESIFGDVKPGCYPSPSTIRANRKKIVKKADDGNSPSAVKLEKRQGLTSRHDEYSATPALSDPLTSLKKKKGKVTVGESKPIRESNRPDDWLGSGRTQKRTWRVKTKSPEE